MKNGVVVTGASTGIGAATTAMLVEHGFHVFGNVRKSSDADRLTAAHGTAVTPLIFDVTDAKGIARSAQQVANALAGDNLVGLVNNAGIALGGPLMHFPIDDFREQLEVNVIGQLAVTQPFLPLLGARAKNRGVPGRVVMMSSVSGRIATPLMGAYAASKHALEGMSDTLRRELMLYGIDVIVIQPGAVRTPIWDKAEQLDRDRYAKTDYAWLVERMLRSLTNLGRRGLPPEVIARAVLKALTAEHPPSRITLTGARLLSWTLPRLLPDRIVDAAVRRSLKLSRETLSDRQRAE